MSQSRPDFHSIRTFRNDQDYQFILVEALSRQTLDRSTMRALRKEFGRKNLENTRGKWLLRSIYLSVWHYVCILRAQGKSDATIAQDLRTCTGLPYTDRMIGIYAKEDFFRDLLEGTIITTPIVPSPDLSRATSAANSAMSLVNEDEEECHELSTVPAATMKLQPRSRHLSNIDFTRMTDEPMPLENERGFVLLDDYAMQPGVGASSTGKNLEFEQISQLGLCTPNLDSMPGPGTYFSNDRLSGYMEPQGTIGQGAYYQDNPYQSVFNHQHADFSQVQAMHPGDSDIQDFRKPFANEQYSFQHMHVETSLGPNEPFGPISGSGIGHGSQHIDPRLFGL